MFPINHSGIGRLALAFALGAACLLARPTTAHAQSVTDRFKQAQRLHAEGKVKPAYRTLVGIVKKYPDHQPSRLLLGSILFRSGNVKQAARQFKRVSPDLLSGDVAYEYGIVFYQARDCRRAKSGFAKVPGTSKLADLASFYRGLCHLQGREYQKAQIYLTRAKRLPPSLVRTRREALAAVRKSLRSERQGSGFASNPYVIVPTAPPPVALPTYDPYPQTPPPDSGAPAAPEKKPPPPPPPKAGTTSVVTPSLTLTQQAVSKDFFGTRVDDSETFTSELKLGFKSKYDAEPRASGEQPYVSLAGDVTQNSTNARGSSVTYKVYQDKPGEIIESEETRAPTTTTTGTVKLTLEGGYPAGSAVDLTGGYNYRDRFPDMKSEGKTNEAGPYGSFNLEGETMSLKLSASQSVYDDPTAKINKTALTLAADVNKSFDTSSVGLLVQQVDVTWKRATPVPAGEISSGDADAVTQSVTADAAKNWESTSLTFALTLKQVENKFPQVYVMTGEAQSLKVEASVVRTFEFGGSLSGTASTEQLTDYQDLVNDLSQPVGDDKKQPQGLAKGDGSRNSFSLTFKLTPVDWIFGAATYRYTTFDVAVGDPKLEAEFQKANVEVTSEFTLTAGLSKSF